VFAEDSAELHVSLGGSAVAVNQIPLAARTIAAFSFRENMGVRFRESQIIRPIDHLCLTGGVWGGAQDESSAVADVASAYYQVSRPLRRSRIFTIVDIRRSQEGLTPAFSGFTSGLLVGGHPLGVRRVRIVGYRGARKYIGVREFRMIGVSVDCRLDLTVVSDGRGVVVNAVGEGIELALAADAFIVRGISGYQNELVP
jgi:hypothetical protein